MRISRAVGTTVIVAGLFALFGCSQEVGEPSAGSSDPLVLQPVCIGHQPMVGGQIAVAVHGVNANVCPVLTVGGTRVAGDSAWRYVFSLRSNHFICDPTWADVASAAFGAQAASIAVPFGAPIPKYCIYFTAAGTSIADYGPAAQRQFGLPASAISPVMSVAADWSTEPGAGQCPSCNPGDPPPKGKSGS